MNRSASPEDKKIRENLKLRYNTLYDCYEVYSSFHGSGGVLQWIKISDEVCEWYKKHFKLKVTEYIQPSLNTGGILSVAYTEKPRES